MSAISTQFEIETLHAIRELRLEARALFALGCQDAGERLSETARRLEDAFNAYDKEKWSCVA